MPSIYERNRLRRSLIQLASVLVLMLLACGLISLFSLWSMQRLYAQAQARQESLLAAVNDARSAQVAFKIEVQSWKNLLLRGDVEVDYAAALGDLKRAETATTSHLKATADWATSAGNSAVADDITHLLAEHATVGRAYRDALPVSGQMARLRNVADTAVRGVDRPLNEALDRLVENMLEVNRANREQAERSGRQRFDLLSHLIWLSLGASLALVSVLLWRTLRDPALRR